jgi:hypothetical protein
MSKLTREDEKLVDETVRLIKEGNIPFVMFGWVLTAEERCGFLGAYENRLVIQRKPSPQPVSLLQVVLMDDGQQFIDNANGTTFRLDDVMTREGGIATFQCARRFPCKRTATRPLACPMNMH